MSVLGVGLIGCGMMGRSLGQQLRTIEQARLLAVADINADAARAAAGELSAAPHESAAALLETPGLDAVIIASPGFLHRELTEQAAAAGKHVFVEKPMAANVADCDAMLSAAERAGISLMVGQVLRYYPCWARILELVRAGEIGQPIGIQVTRVGSGYGAAQQPWRNSLEQSGGLLMEVNAHEIDFMRQVAGEVTRVYAEADHYLDDPADYPNLLFVSLRFASGAVGLLDSSHVSFLPELSGRIQGSEGAIAYRGGFSGEILVQRPGEERRSIPISALEMENPVRRELRLFVESVLAGEPPPIPGREGRANVAVAAAAYESARRGTPVVL